VERAEAEQDEDGLDPDELGRSGEQRRAVERAQDEGGFDPETLGCFGE
jgi:hypothetical protein